MGLRCDTSLRQPILPMKSKMSAVQVGDPFMEIGHGRHIKIFVNTATHCRGARLAAGTLYHLQLRWCRQGWYGMH